MKKLSIIMAIVMLFVSCMYVTASAQTGTENSLTVSVNAPGKVTQGNEFTLSVDFAGNTGFNTLGVELTYPEGFEYVSAQASNLIKEKFYLDFAGYEGETYVFYHNEEARTVTFVGASLYDISEANGSLFSVKFTTPEDVSTGNAFSIALVDTAYNEVGDTVTTTVNGSSLDVIEYILGDVDGNGSVQTADAMLAFFAAAKKVTLNETQTLAANVLNADGLTTADAMRIFYYAAKKITSF